MVAKNYSSAVLYDGLRARDNVTNTFGGYFQSSGSAWDITLPFQPDKFEWYNYTHFATGGGGTNAQGVWFRDMPAGDGLIISITPTTVLETTNAVTELYTAAAFTDEHVTITGATTATPCVVTAASHGLATGDRIMITKVIGTIGAELNNKVFVVKYLTANTFALYDEHGTAITTAGAYGSSGQLNKMGPKLGVVMSQPVYKLTLGTAIVGADNDIIYFTAYQFNNYVNFGDTAP